MISGRLPSGNSIHNWAHKTEAQAGVWTVDVAEGVLSTQLAVYCYREDLKLEIQNVGRRHPRPRRKEF